MMPAALHDDVEPAEIADRPRQRRGGRRLLRHVGDLDRADRVGRRVEVDAHHPGAGFGETGGDGAADAAGRAGDDCPFAVERFHHGTSPRSMPSVWPVMLAASGEARKR